MKISVKGRYALIATLILAENYEFSTVTAIRIAENFKISKIYLEQVFALLKRSGVVTSIKGAQGGYKLSRDPKNISLYDILGNIELSLFEKTDRILEEGFDDYETSLENCIYTPLDNSIEKTFAHIKLADILKEYENNKSDNNFMYYI